MPSTFLYFPAQGCPRGAVEHNKYGYLRSFLSSHVLAAMHGALTGARPRGRAHRSAGPEGAIPPDLGIGPLINASLTEHHTMECRTIR